MIKSIALCLILAFCAIPVVHAEREQIPFTPDYETAEVRSLSKKGMQQRAVMSYELKRQEGDGPARYILTTEGTGDWHTFKDIIFSGTTTMEERNGYLYPQEVRFHVKEKSGAPVISYHLDFDYRTRRIYWTSQRADGKIMKQTTFPLKGITTDPVSMFHFLRPFAAKASEGVYEPFYLLTFEPSLYKVFIRQMPVREDEAHFEPTPSIKLKFTANMGIVDNLLRNYVLHTYMWFKNTPPFDWLQYVGMETGRNSTNVIAYVTARTFQDPQEE